MYPRPNDPALPAFLRAYVDGVPDGDVLERLEWQGRHVAELLRRMPAERAAFAYAPGKWPIVRLVQHLIDGERLFGFRALCIARGDPQDLPGFDEDVYAANDGSAARSFGDLADECAVVRAATIALFRSFDPVARERRGTANGRPHSVASLPWIVAGHELHHLRVLEERYGAEGAVPGDPMR